MLTIYFVCVLIPVVLTNIIFYQITSNNVREQKLRDTSRAIEQIRNEFYAQVEAIAGISAVMYNDSLLLEYLEENYEQPAEYVQNYHAYIVGMLEKYSPVYNAIQAITIYSDNDSLVFGGRVRPITDEVRASEWYRRIEADASTNPVLVRSLADVPLEAGETVSLVRRMNVLQASREYEHLLKIDLHPERVMQLFRNVTLKGDIYILEGGAVRFSSEALSAADEGAGMSDNPLTERMPADRQLYPPEGPPPAAQGMPEEQQPIPEPAGLAAETFFDPAAAAADRGTIVYEYDFGDTGYFADWEVAAVFKERIVLEEVRRSRLFVLYLAIPNVVVPTLIILWITRSLNVRIVRILKHMKRVKNHVFETIRDAETKDEIGQLTTEFNRMTLQIERLIRDVYMADIAKKGLELKSSQAQLHALQSQVNPHFLFNALETIRMRSLMKQEDETARIIHNMAKIFRKSLQWGKDRVPVKDEMELVVCFLEIQKYRFGDKLNYRLDIDKEAEKALLPKMTLQPLVENASIHGIEPLKQAGTIWVAVKQTNDGLVCTVRDNGIGMSRERLDALLADLEENDEIGEHVGIKNVYYRLKLYYGEGFRMRVDSEQGFGTTVEITLMNSV